MTKELSTKDKGTKRAAQRMSRPCVVLTVNILKIFDKNVQNIKYTLDFCKIICIYQIFSVILRCKIVKRQKNKFTFAKSS